MTLMNKTALPLAALSILVSGAIGTSVSAATIVSSAFDGDVIETYESRDLDLNGNGNWDIRFSNFGASLVDLGPQVYQIGDIVYATRFVSTVDGSDIYESVTGFSPGDSISAASGIFESYGILYHSGSDFDNGFYGTNTMVQNVGDQGYIGIEMLVGHLGEPDGFTNPDFILDETYYGWLGVEHGILDGLDTIILGDFGLQNESGLAALIPNGPTVPTDPISAVPLPAGLPMLLAGLGTFGFLRRRKSKL